MRRAAGVTVGVTVGAVGFVAALCGLVLLGTGRPGSNGDDPVTQLLYFLNGPATAIVGALLIARRPAHWSGWVLAGVGFVAGFDAVCQGVLSHWVLHETWTDGSAPWVGWFDNWMWPTYLVALLIVMLKFSGSERSTRWWRRVARAGLVAGAALMLLCTTLDTSASLGSHHLHTAVNLGVGLDAAGPYFAVAITVIVVALVSGVVAMTMHWRRAQGVERAQVRWVLWSFLSVVVTILLSALVALVISALGLHAELVNDALSVVQELSLLTIPLSIYVSVTRFGLFEIDRVVSRTATYTVLTTLLTLAYAALVTSTTRLLPDRLGSLGVAGATLTVAALFLPARRRLIEVMDRRFNRGRVDAERVVSIFAEHVRHENGADPTGTDLLDAVGQVFQPSAASVWLVRR